MCEEDRCEDVSMGLSQNECVDGRFPSLSCLILTTKKEDMID